MVKILHINDICGNAYVLSKFYNKLGHESRVITAPRTDPFNFAGVYGNLRLQMVKGADEEIINVAMKHIDKYHIIHVHSFPKFFKFIKNLPRGKLLLSYWGSDVRIRPYPNEDREVAEQMADLIFAGNPDLVKLINFGNVEYLPIPIDTELFSPNKHEGNGMFTFTTPTWDIDAVKRLLNDNMIKLDFEVIDRTLNGVKHQLLPDLIRKYQSYLDIKIQRNYGLLPAHSATGLQALACGLDVFNYKLQWVKTLPEEHKAINVCSQILDSLKK